jgi:ABC-type sugar transport system ATPase subunit
MKMAEKEVHISVRDLTMAYGDFVVMRDLSFDINRADIFIVMGGSGCGKSFSTIHFGFTGVWTRPIGISSLTWIDKGPGISGLWAHTPYRILASE